MVGVLDSDKQLIRVERSFHSILQPLSCVRCEM